MPKQVLHDLKKCAAIEKDSATLLRFSIRACRALLAEEGVEHKAEEGQPMEAGEGWREAFVIAT